MSIESIKADLARYGLTPNRALGQNFLCDDAASLLIARAACIDSLPVLEIGPGLGALTLSLTELAPAVTAVELDGNMVRALNDKFAGHTNLTVIRQDFLDFDIELYAKANASGWCAVGNLPYYITTPICMKLLNCSALPARITLMLQKEAAARFTAPVGTKLYGPLSVTASLYYTVNPLLSLSPASYYPQPDVDSAVITLDRREDVPFEPRLEPLLKAAFSMRRKTLVNNLRPLGLQRDAAIDLVASVGLDEAARAERAQPEQLLMLAKTL